MRDIAYVVISINLLSPIYSLHLDVQNAVQSGCHIDITELNERHPLFLDTVTRDIRYPDLGTSTINLDRKETLELDCPGSGKILAGNLTISELVTITCVSGWDVEISKQIIDIREIVCSSRITNIARYTGEICWGSYKDIEIGFEVQDGRFLFEMSACFDDIARNTLYTKFTMTKQIGSATTGNSKPSWNEGNFYNLGTRLNNLYTKINQRDTINKLLGLKEDDEKYVKSTGNYYCAKGHLTARADFIYNSQQQGTYHYVNAAPQWQTFNANNWFYLEKNLRIYAETNTVDLEVYTGTYGISTLPHERTGKEVPLYLYVDDNGNKAMPVPELFWKVVYDPENQAGIAVLGINNPYQTQTTESIICNDIADELTWLTFDRTNIEAGYMYACTIEDLRKVIPELPRFQVDKLLN